jgi:tetratricopeptide (TPR) repeat protein
MRYRLLESVRQYAEARVGPEAEALRIAHVAFFTALAEEAAPEIVRTRELTWGRRLRAERPNISAALAGASKAGAAEDGLRLAGTLHYFWLDRDHLREGDAVLETLLALPGPVEPLVRALALLAAANLASVLSDESRAERHASEALALYRAEGDSLGAAHALLALAVADDSGGKYERMRDRLGQALPLYRAAGDEFGVRRTLHLLGNAARELGDLGDARKLLREAAALAEFDRFHSAAILHALGDVELEAGEPAAARSTYVESLGLAREVDAHRIACYCIGGLAAVEGSRSLWGIVEALERALDFHLRSTSRSRYERLLPAGETPFVANASPEELIGAALDLA